MYLSRSLEKTIEKVQKSFPVLLVTGPRQVGKTTLLHQISRKNRNYVSLDNPLARELALTDPGLFFQKYQPPLLIDEIQYAPTLLPYIKMQVDQDKKMGDFWLTGSQVFPMMKNVSESLAGRVGILPLLGLSTREILGLPSTPFKVDREEWQEKSKSAKPQQLMEVFARIFKGSMPALYSKDIPLEVFFSSYIQTYLQRDIKDLTQVADELTFFRFLTGVAARTSQVLNYAELAKDCGISQPTAKQWLSILISSGMIALVEPYFNNVLKRSIKSPKLYFLDTGICSYLTKWTSPESLEAGAMSGAMFETHVVGEIIKSYYNVGLRPPLYYYRDKDQSEIDLILYENDTLYPIEIKKSTNPGKSAIKQFNVLHKTGLTIGYGCVLCLIDEPMPIDNKNWLVPIGLI
jgi:predicted AAA+ superfamily ATPase